MKRKILPLLLAILVIIQFFPIKEEKTNYDVSKAFENIHSDDTAELTMLKNACYDCHSYQTNYPGYTRVQPVGWWLRSHVRGGISKLNFSTWGNLTPNKRLAKLEDCIEVIEDTRMPPSSYKLMHPESKLTSAENQQLIKYFKSLQ